ncbi:MAG TPA: bifunctional 5,10-methylenetetrahydrofolate dehydrogenase/5,10-methenyltetrahydrofolate cyclohydrolase [Patescibacteria group bacterium]|nr:bifunctional 5,10-methylenetetrahydrofolate dehydrogenase/5,10-methenyltetrahydrofolate cyclohydrolase [Patescibacteria group bacterium]
MEINGREIASQILDELKTRVQNLKEKGITPTLQIILVGENPGSESYVKQKKVKGQEIGVNVNVLNIASDVTTEELISTISKFNNDISVHGIIVQRPLPPQIDSEKIDNAVIPTKDIDGFNQESKFQLPLGTAVVKILENVFELRSKVVIIDPKKSPNRNLFHSWLQSNSIVIVGKGTTGGLPVIRTLRKIDYYLDEENIIDSNTRNKTKITKKADVIISAVGKPNIIKPEMIKKGAILISIGLFKGPDGKMHGDYDEKSIKNIASFYTPTPGGVGPVNVAMLLKNLVETAAE